ncbi:hypothetical protein GOQ24_08605, partial [Myroides sp. LoEW2-1]|nr:hypothetical protein [Myroides sp. LoEW2-1]
MSQEKQNNELSIENFNTKVLKEIKSKEDEQLQIVTDNPYIEITDNETFTIAKKRRTNYVTARTSLEKEKKAVINKIKENITVPITELYNEFILITKPHEEKQQIEVKRWEDIKEQERQEKLQIEEKRKATHKNNIKLIVSAITEEIKALDYKGSLVYQVEPILNGEVVELDKFEEFGTTLLSELE